MDRRTDRTMKEIHQFLREHATEDMSMDEINDLLSTHMQEINAAITKEKTEETVETADDFMDLAEEKLEAGDRKSVV